MHKQHQLDQASVARKLSNLPIRYHKTSYGFRIEFDQGEYRYCCECGREHNGGISMSLRSEPPRFQPPVRWYTRYAMSEIADLLVVAYYLSIREKRDWADCLEVIDSKYDYAALERLLEKEFPLE